MMIVRQVQAGATIGGNIHQVTFISQPTLEHFQDGRVVFNDQDTFVHIVPLTTIYHNLLVE